MEELGMVVDFKNKRACWDGDGKWFQLRQQPSRGHFIIDMLESFDTCMKDRADQTLLPHDMLDHVRVQHRISPYTFLGDEVLAYEESVDFIGTM
eukprot:8122316-Pyramimonas_sp.AAC.1